MSDLNNGDGELAIQDRVLVEADIDGRTVYFRAVMVKVCPDELWLGMASPDRRLETMRPDQAVRLTIARSGAALLGESAFLRLLGGSKSRIFAVVRPSAIEKVQRRAHLRYQVDLPIIFRHTDPETREPRGKAAVATTINVSPGGALLKGEIPVVIGEELALILPLSAEDRISILAVVTRIRGGEGAAPGEAAEDGHTEVAIKFTRLTAVDQEHLLRFIILTEHRCREAALRQPPVQAAVPAAAPAPMPEPTQLPVRAAAVPAAAPASVPAAAPVALPRPAVAAKPDAEQPLIAVGLRLCEAGQAVQVRVWFDSLMPGSRIELLSQLQANMAGGSVPGAAESASVRPLAVALGLLAA